MGWRVSLVAQMVKNPPAMRETWVQSLVWEDPLEEGVATHFSILAWRIPMDRGAWRAPWGHKESDTTEWQSKAQTSSFQLSYILNYWVVSIFQGWHQWLLLLREYKKSGPRVLRVWSQKQQHQPHLGMYYKWKLPDCTWDPTESETLGMGTRNMYLNKFLTCSGACSMWRTFALEWWRLILVALSITWDALSK